MNGDAQGTSASETHPLDHRDREWSVQQEHGDGWYFVGPTFTERRYAEQEREDWVRSYLGARFRLASRAIEPWVAHDD